MVLAVSSKKNGLGLVDKLLTLGAEKEKKRRVMK
jgi:hypothetical protein